MTTHLKHTVDKLLGEVIKHDHTDLVDIYNDQIINGNKTLNGNVILNGSFTANSAFIVHTENISVSANHITLNNNLTGSPFEDAGIIVNRGNQSDSILEWNEAVDRWQVGLSANPMQNIIIGSDIIPITSNIQNIAQTSGNWNNVYSTVSTTSGIWNAASGSIIIPIDKTSHGFTISDIGRPVTLYDTFALATSPSGVETIGLIQSIVNANKYKVIQSGKFTKINHGFTPKSVLFVSESSPGTLTETTPTIYNKPIAKVIDQNNLQIIDNRPSAGATDVLNNFKSSTSFTRPNNSDIYTINDVVGTNPATNIVFSNIGSSAGGTVILTKATLRLDNNSLPVGIGNYRLHLFTSAPTAILDNSPFDVISADFNKYIGYIQFDTPILLGSTCWSQTFPIEKEIILAANSTTIYGVLQTLGSYTPTAQININISLIGLGV